MSAGGAVQAQLAASLTTIADLTGVFDGPPARAAFPYAAIDASLERDWSHKSGSGREVMIAVTVWDDQPARLQMLADQVEAKVAAILRPTWPDLPRPLTISLPLHWKIRVIACSKAVPRLSASASRARASS